MSHPTLSLLPSPLCPYVLPLREAQPASAATLDFQALGAPPLGDWAALEQAMAALPAETLPARAWIWGAGGFGRALALRLRAAGCEPLGFIDAKVSQTSQAPVDGLRCIHPDHLDHLERGPILIGVHNFTADLEPVYARLEAMGFEAWGAQRLWKAAAHQQLGWPGVFWLDTPFWGVEQERHDALTQARVAFELFADQASQRVFWGELCSRALGDPTLRARPEPQQYAPASLPRWAEPMRLIDAGAFDGDTLRAFKALGLQLEAAHCFEPDLANFDTLAATRPRGQNAFCWPLGVSDRAQTLRFRFDGAASSRQSEAGEAVVQCVGLDQAMGDFSPTLIKMDIEGAELDALEGARALITRSQTGLAVAAYHTPDHLWRVPLKMQVLLPSHRLFLRPHGFNGFDTIAYAVPR